MARSQNAFNKKEKEKKRQQKKKEKQERKEERKATASSGDLEDMLAYVDDEGNIIDAPPEPTQKKEIKASSIEIGIPKKEKEDPNAERRGRVAFYDMTKGYGFINQDGTQERFFVHSSSLTRQIQEGDKVSFQTKKGLKGMEAINVKVL